MQKPTLKNTTFSFLFLLTSLFYLLTSVQHAAAHVLEANGSVGAVLHIDPEDDPIAKQQSTFFFAFKDKEGKFTSSNCDCRVSISQQGKEIFSQSLFQNSTDPSLTNASFSFIFPQKDVYTITVVGKPYDTTAFTPFTLSYPIRVAREESPASSPTWITTHLLHIILGIVISSVALYYFFTKRLNKHV